MSDPIRPPFSPMRADRVLDATSKKVIGIIHKTVYTGDNEYEATLTNGDVMSIGYDPQRNAWVQKTTGTVPAPRRKRRMPPALTLPEQETQE